MVKRNADVLMQSPFDPAVVFSHINSSLHIPVPRLSRGAPFEALFKHSSSSSQSRSLIKRMVATYFDSEEVAIEGVNLSVEVRVELDAANAKARVDESSNWVLNKIMSGGDIYGVTTGFGSTSHRRTQQGVELQRELIRLLNAGVKGHSLPAETARAAMLVRTNTLMHR